MSSPELECRSQLERAGGRQRGDRIVACGLPRGHGGRWHMETETGVTWATGEPMSMFDERILALRDEVEQLRRERDGFDRQIAQLASFIASEVPGEPSQSEGAVECAIRIMRGCLGEEGVIS